MSLLCLFFYPALQTKAKKFEIRGLQKNKINRAHLYDLDELLNDIFVSSLPKPIDYDHRRDLVRIFNEIAKEIYGIHSEFLQMPKLPQCTHRNSIKSFLNVPAY